MPTVAQKHPSKIGRPLSEALLADLRAAPPTGSLSVFNYDRSLVRPGIVHIGVGAFHRAHMAVYIDSVLARGDSYAWGICGVGLLPQDAAMAHAMAKQNNLFTVLERHQQGTSARIIGAMVQFLHAPSDPSAVLERLADAQTRIVSLTITESGYHVNEATGHLDIMHPDIQMDLQRPHAPKTFYGYLCAALERRRLKGIAPFTVMSCDNVQHNGDLTRRMLLAFAKERGGELAPYIERHGSFPNSMVDRITPRTTEQDQASLQAQFGISDHAPVVTEPFSQWVIEDAFSCGRPALERVGVQLASDVAPYETMKLRLLNGGHSAIAYLGFLAGFTYVHEVLQDARFAGYIQQLMLLEVLPTLPPVPGIDLPLYSTTLLSRFLNPNIADQLTRLCFDGSGKLPKFIFPSIEANIATNLPFRRLALCVAAWLRYLTGKDEGGRAFEVHDPMVGQLQPLARQGGQDPTGVLAASGLFGETLRESKVFVDEVQRALKSLYERGVHETLASYVE